MPSNIPLLVPAGLRRRSKCGTLFLLLVPIILIYYSSSYLPGLLYYRRTHPQNQTLGQHTDNKQTSYATKQDPDFPLGDTTSAVSQLLCKPDECMQGSWVPRDPPFRSLADFHTKYPPTHRGNFKICGSEENKREDEDRNHFHKTQEERLVRAANWVWKPTKGRLREWNPIDFVVRLLQSPGGLIFSGDSITRQHFQWLEYALARADIYITEDPSHLPSYSHNRLHQFILRPGDPMTAYLQERAGVPDSRLQRPIYTKFDNHILIGEKEVREFTIPLGAKENFPWYDIFEYFEGWESFVRDAATPREGEKGVSEDTILVLNTGAHWSRGSWYMLPKTGDIDEQQLRVTTAFKKMIELITARLNPIQNLSIYYRAAAPGHPGCPSSSFYKTFRVNSTITSSDPGAEDHELGLFTNAPTFYTSPYKNTAAAWSSMEGVRKDLEASTLDKQQKVVRSRWDWDRLEDHNTEWKLVIDSMNEKRGGLPEPEISRGAKWYYMDIWNMALQRPDAHTQNLVDPAHENYDCLHWCVPNVVEQWMEYLGHLVLSDS